MMKKVVVTTLALVLLLWAASYTLHCRIASLSVAAPHVPGSVQAEPPVALMPPAPTVAVTYTTHTLATDTPKKELVTLVGVEHLDQVLSLNRLDAAHLRKGQSIVVPSTFDDSWALSAFPRSIAALQAVPKVLLVSQRVQEFAAYEYGQLVRFGGVSTGKKSTQTPSKLYHTNWKGRLVTSTVDDSWIMPWYFNLDNFLGVSMHEYELPGYPASHSCVRLSSADAQWLYQWADEWQLTPDHQRVAQNGTPVLLFGTYDFTAPAPWKKLPEDVNAIKVDVEKEIVPNIAL